MNRPAPVLIRCAARGCTARTPLFEPDDGWIRDASHDWCPEHAPQPIFDLDDFPEE